MKKKQNLTDLTILYGLGNFSSKLFSFLLIFITTHRLTKAEVGTFDIISASTSFVVPVLSLQIGVSVFRWMLDSKSREREIEVLGNAASILLINLGLFTITFWASYHYFSFKYAGFIFVLCILQTLSGVLQQALRGLQKNREFVWIGVISAILNSGLSLIALLFFNLGLRGLLIANLISLLVVVCILFIHGRLFTVIKLRWSSALITHMLRFSLPLLPNSFSWLIITSATRFVILQFLGVDANGIFAIAYKLPFLIMMFADIFYLAWQEKVITELADVREGSAILQKYFNILFSVVLVLTSLVKPLMAILAGDNFFDSWKYSPILLYATAIQGIAAYYGAIYLRTKQTTGLLFSSFVGALISGCFCFMLTGRLGLYGTSISILMGFTVMLLVRIVQTRSIYPVVFPYFSLIITTSLFLLAVFINYSDSVWALFLSFCISLTAACFLNKDVIYDLKRRFL